MNSLQFHLDELFCVPSRVFICDAFCLQGRGGPGMVANVSKFQLYLLLWPIGALEPGEGQRYNWSCISYDFLSFIHVYTVIFTCFIEI